MKDTYYVLAKVVWCGECDDFAIEKIIRIQRNIPFTNKEINYYINLDYIYDDEDKGIEEYIEGDRLYYYVDHINYDFNPHYDGLAEALALYTVYHYQQAEITSDTFNNGEQKKKLNCDKYVGSVRGMKMKNFLGSMPKTLQPRKKC